MKKSSSILGGFLLLAACSSDHSGGGGSGSTSKKVFSKSYSFSINGCATGEQTFTSEVSEADATDKLCAGLADDTLNKGCAPFHRVVMFTQTCGGKDWKALQSRASEKNKAAATPSPTAPTQPTVTTTTTTREYRTGYYAGGGRMMIASLEFAPGLSKELEARAQKLASDMNSCGLDSFGPNCLDKTHFASASITQPEKNVLRAESTLADSTPLVLLMHMAPDASPTRVQTIDVLWGSGTKLFTATIAPDRAAQARQNLERAIDLRMLHHSAQAVHDPQLKAAAFTANKRMIIDSDDVTYQEAILPMVRASVSPATMLEISEALVDSPSETVRQIAAMVIVKADPSRKELRPLVIKATESSNYANRKAAVETLGAIPRTADETSVLLGKISDSDNEIAEIARKATKDAPIAAENAAAVQKLAAGNYKARLSAVPLLQRLGTPDATRQVIAMTGDADSEIAKSAAQAIEPLQLGPEFLPALRKQLDSGNYRSRIVAAQAIARVPGSSATQTLIARLQTESDNDVQKAIVASLEPRTIGEAEVSALDKIWAASNYYARLQITRMIDKNTGAAASLAMINRLGQESDNDVRKALVSSLLQRSLSEALVAPTAKLFAGSYPVRLGAAQILGNIKGEWAKTALQEQLGKESDSDVKRAIEKALAAH